MSSPQPGAEVAGYRLESVVGRGGMGVVYLAEDLRLKRKVALKVLAPELSGNDAFRTRFVRESQMAASLDHPNIVPIYAAGEADGLLYIVMRFVKGADLKSVLRREWLLAPARAIDSIGVQVAGALDAAHARGFVHRDVKPGNVLISSEASSRFGEHCYLSDFGLTRHITSHSGITGTGQFVGTVEYIAPEQILGQEVDGRSDVYSLGCMLFQCLCGRLPFDRDNDIAQIYAHLTDPPPAVTSVAPRLPAALDDVFRRAMAKDREERFDTCSELVAAAHEAFQPPVLSPGDETVDRNGLHEVGKRKAEPARRSVWLVALLGVLLAGLLAVGVVIAMRGRTPSTTPPAGTSNAGAVMVVSASGGAARTFATDGASNPHPAWSSDGTLLAYVSAQAGLQFITVEPTGPSGARAVVTVPRQTNGPVWSPDGRIILFVSYGVGTSEVFKVHADGSRLSRLVRGFSSETDPEWSPDGSSVVFAGARQGPEGIFVLRPDGSVSKPLGRTPGPPANPAWSPDGKRIAFADSGGSLFVMDGDGAHVTRVAPPGVSALRPEWSPDGRVIAFVGRAQGSARGVFVVPSSGGAARRMTARGVVAFGVAWSPDGSKIAYIGRPAGSSGGFQVFVMNADGAGARQLTHLAGTALTVAWSPDGSELAVGMGP